MSTMQSKKRSAPPSKDAVIALDRLVKGLVRNHLGKTFTAASLEILQGGHPLFSGAFGELNPEAGKIPCVPTTQFDIASITKLFTTTLAMRLCEIGAIRLDDTVALHIPEFTGERSISPYPDPLDAGKVIHVVPETKATTPADTVTIRDLLTHTSGLPAWLPFFRLRKPTENSSTAIQEAASRAIVVTPFAYPRGEAILYSDIGFILLAELVRRVTHKRFSEALNEHVLSPLGRSDISFSPTTQEHCAATEICPYRGRRLWGEVDDENAWAFGGKAAHAGLFGTAQAVAAFGASFIASGKPLLIDTSIQELTKVQAEKKGIRRGLGFQFSSAGEGSSTGALSTHAVGHFGFTGSSLWIDRERDLVCVLLTNRLYFGRTNAGPITEFRRAMHEVVMKVVQVP